MRKLLPAAGAVLLAGVLLPGLGSTADAAAGQPAAACHNTVYVVDAGNGTVVPVDTVTRKAGRPIALPDGTHDDAGDILVAENHAMAYVLNGADEDQSVTPINTRTNKAGAAIPVSTDSVGPYEWATPNSKSPDGKTLLVLGVHTVTPISVASNRAGKPVNVGAVPADIATTGGGKTAWIVNEGSGTLVSVNYVTGKVSKPVKVGTDPVALALRPCPVLV